MKTKSTFTIVKLTDSMVFLVDRIIGMSVTNDAENVCENISQQYPDKRIIYRDTDGRWDELVHKDGVFTGYKSYSGDVPDGF